MRRIKSSVKAIIISICAVVLAVSATVGIILLSRDKGGNPPAEYALTQAQKDLVLDIKNVNSQTKENTLKELDTSKFTDETGAVIPFHRVQEFYDKMFIASNNSQVNEVYLYATDGSGKSVNLFKQLKINGVVEDYYAIKFDGLYGDYVAYTYMYQKEGQHYKVAEIAYVEDKDNIVVVNQIVIKVFYQEYTNYETHFYGEYTVYSYTVAFSKSYYITTLTYDKDDATYCEFTVSAYTKGLPDESKNETISFEFLNNDIGGSDLGDDSIIVYFVTAENPIIVQVDNGVLKTFDFEIKPDQAYSFDLFPFGIFVSIEKRVTPSSVDDLKKTSVLYESDSASYYAEYTYQYLSFEDGKVVDIKLDKDYAKLTVFKDGLTNAFRVFAQKVDDVHHLEEDGLVTYYASNADKIIRYKASNDASKIEYSKNYRILTTDGIISTRNQVDANFILEFGTEKFPYQLYSENVVNDNFMMYNNAVYSVMNINGHMVFENSGYTTMHDYRDGLFFVYDDEDYFILNAVNREDPIQVSNMFVDYSEENVNGKLEVAKGDAYYLVSIEGKKDKYSLFDYTGNCVYPEISNFNKQTISQSVSFITFDVGETTKEFLLKSSDVVEYTYKQASAEFENRVYGEEVEPLSSTYSADANVYGEGSIGTIQYSSAATVTISGTNITVDFMTNRYLTKVTVYQRWDGIGYNSSFSINFSLSSGTLSNSGISGNVWVRNASGDGSVYNEKCLHTSGVGNGNFSQSMNIKNEHNETTFTYSLNNTFCGYNEWISTGFWPWEGYNVWRNRHHNVVYGSTKYHSQTGNSSYCSGAADFYYKVKYYELSGDNAAANNKIEYTSTFASSKYTDTKHYDRAGQYAYTTTNPSSLATCYTSITGGYFDGWTEFSTSTKTTITNTTFSGTQTETKAHSNVRSVNGSNVSMVNFYKYGGYTSTNQNGRFNKTWYSYAFYKENSYKIKYHYDKYMFTASNTATTFTTDSTVQGADPTEVTMGYLTKVTSMPAPTLEGYNFKGWYKADGTGKLAINDVKLTTTNNGTVDRYAFWEAADVDVKLNFNAVGDPLASSVVNTTIYVRLDVKKIDAKGYSYQLKSKPASTLGTELTINSVKYKTNAFYYDADNKLYLKHPSYGFVTLSNLVIDTDTKIISSADSAAAVGAKFVMNEDSGQYYIIDTQTVSTKFGTDDQFTIKIAKTSSVTETVPSYVSSKYNYFINLNDTLSYNASGNIKALMDGNSASTDADLKPYTNPSKISVFGSGYQFSNWGVRAKIQTGSSSYTEFIRNYAESDDSFYEYMFGSQNVSNKVLEITFFAVYEHRDYVIKTSKNEVYGSSKLSDAELTTLNDKIEDYSTVINYNSVQSKTTISVTPFNAKYTNTVVVSLFLNDETAADTEKEPYYIFDKIEVQNFGYRTWSSSKSKYIQGYCTLVFTLTDKSDGTREWAVDFKNIQGDFSGMGVTFADRKYMDKDSSQYYITDGKSGGTQYNIVKVTQATNTHFEFSVQRVGLTGEYDGDTFTFNETTANSGTGGFKVVSYARSNYCANDTIQINTSSSTGIGSVTQLAIQTGIKESGNFTFWIDNVKYTTNGLASGFYRLDGDLTSGKVNLTDYNFDNSYVSGDYIDVVYVEVFNSNNNAYIYYPRNKISSSYGSSITSSSDRDWKSNTATGESVKTLMKNINYENVRMYVVRPEQIKLYTSTGPSSSTLIQSSTAYELTSYLSNITIGTTSINLFAKREIKSTTISSKSTYCYDYVLLDPSTKDTNGYATNASVTFANSGKIKYVGEEYVIQSAVKKTVGSRVFWIYLAKKSNGEYYYFVYSDIDGGKDGATNTQTVKFTFKQFNKTFSISVTDNNDLYDSTRHDSVAYKIHTSRNEFDVSSTSFETDQTGSFNGYTYANYGSANTNLLKSASYTFNPSSYVVLEIVPNSGYLISTLTFKVKNSKLTSNKLYSLSLANLTPTITNSSMIYTTAEGTGAGGTQNFKPSILYTHSGKMFNSYYKDSGNYNGIYCSQNINDNWIQYFDSGSKFKMEHIYFVFAGIYDDIEVSITTVSYSELVFEDSSSVLGYSNSSSFKISSPSYLDGDVYSAKALQNLTIQLYDPSSSAWFKVGSGDINDAKDAYVVQYLTSKIYRVIFLGKAKYMRQGIKIYASGTNYSCVFTDGRLYYDADNNTADSHTGGDLDAFQTMNLTGSIMNGRRSDGLSLYNNGAGANPSIADATSTTLNFTKTAFRNTDLFNYMYIKDIIKVNSKNDWTKTTGDYSSRIFGTTTTHSRQYERSGKLVMLFKVQQNTIDITTNSYIYNNTLTQDLGSGSGGLKENTSTWQTANEAAASYAAGNGSLKIYRDTSNLMSWKFIGSDIYGYQLDYLGKLYDDAQNVIKDNGNPVLYSKQSSWFNNTILTNINYSYYTDQDKTKPKTSINWQSMKDNYNKNGTYTRTIYGYDIVYTYLNIPGYYLQYLELVTVDLGSIYIHVSNLDLTNPVSIYTDKSLGITIACAFNSTEGEYTFTFYKSGTGINDQINSLGILNNDITVNFYSMAYQYAAYLNANPGQSSTDDMVVAKDDGGNAKTISTVKIGGTDYANTIDGSISIYYDSLMTIRTYLEMPGYTFVGWGSQYYTGTTNRYSASTNTWNSSSSWLPVTSYFASSERANLKKYFKTNTYGTDFYVKASKDSEYNRVLKTGYFITDTGNSETENYNFWSVYAKTFMSTITGRKPGSTTPVLTILYGVWKANVYTLTFDTNDVGTNKGSTLHKLEINSGKFGHNDEVNYDFNDAFITGKLGFTQNSSSAKTYYCYVTFDDNDWFITDVAVNAVDWTAYDSYFAVNNTGTGYGNAYETDLGSTTSLAILGSDKSNLVNVIVDRYGYSWLGWFTQSKANANKSTTNANNEKWLVFNSSYYTANLKGNVRKTLPIFGKSTSDAATFAFNATASVSGTGWTDYGKSCVDYRWFTSMQSPYSDFIYVGENKINTEILKTRTDASDGVLNSKYLIAFYNYTGGVKNFSVTGGTKKGYSAIDYLNNKTGSSGKASKASLTGSATTVDNTYITYFDTSLTYGCYSLKTTSGKVSIKILRDSTVATKLKTVTLYANWETNRYDIVIEWRDEETGKEDFAIGSSVSGILQNDETISKTSASNPLNAYFDDSNFATVLNKFNPVRVGYDFIGWTYLYDTAEGVTNNPTVITKDGVETMCFLDNDLLGKVQWQKETVRPIFTDSGLVNSLDFTSRQEAYGDKESATSHFIYIFAIWKPQTFTINIDLNIQAEELENLYEKDSNFAVALYKASGSGASKTVTYTESTGIRTSYYKYNANNYAEIVANINFVVTFDGNFADAYCQIVDGLSVYTYRVEELFAVSTGYYLLGWMYDSLSATNNATNYNNLLFIANGLRSAYGLDGKVTNLNNATSSLVNGFDVFNYTNYLKLNNSNYKPALKTDTGKYGSSNETFNKDNVNKLSELDSAGLSSNFGYVIIGSGAGKKCYITCEDVPGELSSVKHYLYFKYNGVKYYVVYYYLKPVGETSENETVQLTNDHEFLYYTEGSSKYKIRFDTDGHPYTVTDKSESKYYSNRIDLNNRIRMAVYKEKTDSLIDDKNLLNKVTTVGNHTAVGYSFNHDYNTTTTALSLRFVAQTTRQFTLYAHWANKNNFTLDVNNANNIGTTSNSNPGLAGYYDVWNLYDHAVREEGLKYTNNFIPAFTSKTSISEHDLNTGEVDSNTGERIDQCVYLTYNYYDDLRINLNPYFSGRYISKLIFTFYGIEESEYSSVTDHERANFKLQKYILVVKFEWDSENHKIYIPSSGFNLYIESLNTSPEPISTSAETIGNYQSIYNIYTQGVAYDKTNLVDKNNFSSKNDPFVMLYDYGTYYDRVDINQISFNLKNVMSSIEIDCYYSVQTYEVDFYNIKHNAENSLALKEGTNNEYTTPFVADDMSAESEIMDDNPFISSNAVLNQYLATISTDCASQDTLGYNVPYGFYIYGVFYNSPFFDYRPIDEEGSVGVPINVVALLNDPMYGFNYLYSNGYYMYGESGKKIEKAAPGDEYSAQCAGVLGDTNTFNDSIGIRLSGLSFYAFGGWYEYYIDPDTDKVIFVGYNKVAEATYINRNITLFGYYYATNEPTNIQFYTWDKDDKKYDVYTGISDQYTLNENSEKSHYTQIGGYLALAEGNQVNYVDTEGRVKIISYLQYGVDKTKFGMHNYTNSVIMENSNDEAVLGMVLDTYWYYEDSYNSLYFIDVSTNKRYIRYDKDENQFYYLSNENDVDSTRVVVQVLTSDMVNYTLESSDSYNGIRLHFDKNEKLYTTHYGNEYNFTGTNMYAKVNITGVGPDRYYKLYYIENDYFTGSNPYYKTWMDSKKPKYYVDVEGQRFYMLLKNTSGMSKSSVFYDSNGNEVQASESPVRSATLATIKNYYVNYQGYLFQVIYQENTDDHGSIYINPFVNPKTNTVDVTLHDGTVVPCYFNYETKVLYEKLAVVTDSFDYYIKINKANISDVDKYYKVMSVPADYYDRFEEGTWAYINKPAYCVDIAGSRYYITAITSSLGASDIANNQVIYTAQGIDGGPLTGYTICKLNNYYVEYNGVKYPVEYKVFDGYVNPYLDYTNNVIKVQIATNTYEICYFDYTTKTLIANVKASFDNFMYCAVNDNYKINAVMDTDVWLIDNITLKILPSPNIGFWYEGEQYGFVGYIKMTGDIFERLMMKVDEGQDDDTGAGVIYVEFANLINGLYTKESFAEDNFAPGLYEEFLNGRTFDDAYAQFIADLKGAVGTRIADFELEDMLNDLLTAESYDYVEGNTAAIQYITVNIPVTFEDIMLDPRTGRYISLKIVAQHQFDIISTNTVVDTKISAIPIYNAFKMEFTDESINCTSGTTSATIDTSKMDVWHFELTSSSTHIYNKENGDFVNFIVMTHDQFKELQENSVNLADHLTQMINQNKYVKKYTETAGSSVVTINASELGNGDFVVLAYYNKTGVDIEANKYAVRVSDNLININVSSGRFASSEIVRTKTFTPAT